MSDFQRRVVPLLLTPRLLRQRQGRPFLLLGGWSMLAWFFGMMFFWAMALTVTLGWDTLVLVYGGAIVLIVWGVKKWRNREASRQS